VSGGSRRSMSDCGCLATRRGCLNICAGMIIAVFSVTLCLYLNFWRWKSL